MNAIPTPGAPGTPKSRAAGSVRRVPAVLVLALLAAEVQGAAQEQVAAVWKLRNLDFPYRSYTAIYSCNALAGRVAGILRKVGARDDLEVRVNDCNESNIPPDATMSDRGRWTASQVLSDRYVNRSSDRQQFVHVHVRMMIPIEVTPEVLAELKKDKTRRELISEVTGDPMAQFNDPVVFAAQREPVTLSGKTIGLTPKECELLDQMSSTIFRELDMRVVQQSTSCSPDARISPMLVLESLRVYEPPKVEQTPAAGEQEDAGPSAPAASDSKPAEPDLEKTPQ